MTPVRCQLTCVAHADETYSSFPVKLKKKQNLHRYFHFMDITWRGRTLLEKRSGKGIWQGLHQFPLVERSSTRAMSEKQLSRFLLEMAGY